MRGEAPQDPLRVRAFLPTIPWIVPAKPAPECDSHNAGVPNGEVGQVGGQHVNPDRTEDTPRCPREVPHKPPDSPFWSPVSSRHQDGETTPLTDGAWGTAPASGTPRSAATTTSGFLNICFRISHTQGPQEPGLREAGRAASALTSPCLSSTGPGRTVSPGGDALNPLK